MSMETNSQHDADSVGPASEHASLKVILGAVPRQWGDLRATVPPSQARHLITISGILGCVITGTASAVLTLQLSARLVVPAYAEVALALIGAVLMAFCSLTETRKQGTAQPCAVRVEQAREITGSAGPGPVRGP